MTVIAKADACPALWQSLLNHVIGHLRDVGQHPSQTVVVLPYAQLLPLAQRYWGQCVPHGFAPHFETTRSWAGRLRPVVQAPDDWTGDSARDLMTARSLLGQAGLGRHLPLLLPLVLEAAAQLAPAAAAQAPSLRAAWLARGRALLDTENHHWLELEWTACRLALEWVAATTFETDVLWADAAPAATAALVVVRGARPDPLAQALLAHWGPLALELPLLPPAGPDQAAPFALRGHAALDAEDEALRAAACVLQHLQDGCSPVALVDNDRALTRRVTALLETAGVAVCDETGWTLSTTRSAAALVAFLRAAEWDAGADAVLDWLKHCPALPPDCVDALERWLRRRGGARWVPASANAADTPPAVKDIVARAEAWRAALQASRPLAQWLASLRSLLRDCGLWPVLQADAAGAELLRVLRLEDDADTEVQQWAGAGRALALADFVAWTRDVLEAQRFIPAHDATASVVVLPLAQTLGRPFAAAVVPGCDERRLQAAPEPAGPWTAAQRAALGLPTRESLAAALRLAWDSLRALPQVDVLWREADDGGEPLMPSALVQQWRLRGLLALAHDPLAQREVAPTPVLRPAPTAPGLLPERISASAYADLRHCPYRFFALRQLGLQEPEELEDTVEKRDFGSWLHAVLQHFHEGRQAQPLPRAAEVERAALDASAQAVTAALGLDRAGFVPFAAAWPQLREGYLRWLLDHESVCGGRFVAAEQKRQVAWQQWQLSGTLDRMDEATRDGRTVGLLIDYKTESLKATRDRVRPGSEDLQLAFYAALVQGDPAFADRPVAAAYLNVGERGDTEWVEQEDVVASRDQLLAGLAHDLQRIQDGHALPALGEGPVCDHCAARGLCRKDAWA